MDAPPAATPSRLDVHLALGLTALGLGCFFLPPLLDTDRTPVLAAGPLVSVAAVCGVVALVRRRQRMPLWAVVLGVGLLLAMGGLGVFFGGLLWMLSGLPAAG